MTSHVSEHDEFLLSLLLDNDLSAAEAAALRRRLDGEPALRARFETLVRLDRELKLHREDPPAVEFEPFHRRLMERIGEAAGQPAGDVSEQDEGLLGRLLDGELTAAEDQAVRQRLEREPALRRCHEALKRIEATLAGRRADRPAVNYGRLHDRVMAGIRAEAARSPRTVRFPVWLRIAAPLAAAAAIALVVWLQPFAGRPTGERREGIGPMALHHPDRPSADASERPGGQLAEAKSASDSPRREDEPPVVRFKRPRPSTGSLQTIQVNYARSAALAEDVRRSDDEGARRPSRKLFFAATPTAQPSPARVAGDFLDAAPL
ncbi:MAG: hypothetical protein HY718_11315 [Planctomycetes bacterium]|nr:hypothetical protein [Planctomycetota bacterium]